MASQFSPLPFGCIPGVTGAASSLKQDARRAALAWRDALPVEVREDAAKRLVRQTVLAIPPRSLVSGYRAIGSEIDPEPLLRGLRLVGATLCLPVLLDRTTMVFRLWEHTGELIPVGFGTLGPGPDCPEVFPDLVLAPLAAFSGQGQRIGYGKGHYDRALDVMASRGHRPALLGLAHDGQEVPPFPAEEHDVPLDGVLTPSGLRVFATRGGRLDRFLAANGQP